MSDISVNLVRLRKIARLNQEELAVKANITRLAYANIEKGKSVPRSDTLVALAKALDARVADLVRPVRKLASLRYRTGKILSAREKARKDQEIAFLADWLSSYSQLEECLGDTIPYGLADLPEGDPASVAGAVRAALGVPADGPVLDLPESLASAGVKLYFFDADVPGFCGASLGPVDDGPCVAANRQDMTVERQIFTVAHELGHLALRHADSQADDGKQESDANGFASAFLMPDIAFLRQWEESKGAWWVDRVLSVKRYFKVSYQTVLWRLVERGLAGDDIYVSFARQYNDRYRHDLRGHYEPNGLAPLDFVEERFPRLVRTALEREEITLSRAAEMLRLPLSDMRDLYLSWKQEL